MKKLSLVTIAILSTSSASEFQPIGYKSIGMGGAGVASAQGSLAGYYNPALLTQYKDDVEVSLGLGIGVRENNIGSHLDKLSDLELTDTLESIGENISSPENNSLEDRENIVEAIEVLGSIGNKNGLSLMPEAHFGVQVKEYSVGLFVTSDIAVSAHVDEEHLELSIYDEEDDKYYLYAPQNNQYNETLNQTEYNAHSLEYALDNDLTYVDAKGLVLLEVPISYAKTFDIEQGELSVGGSLKLMQGTTYVKKLTIDTDSEESTDDDEWEDNKKDSSNIGIDLGVLFKPNEVENLTVGLVAKNINSPKFDVVEGADLKADIQIRTGLLYTILDDVDFALDLDLTNNNTLINGYKSQVLGGGIDYRPFLGFSIRTGLAQNLANSNEGMIYSAGFGIGMKQFQLDIAGQMSSNSGTYDGEEIPKYSRVYVALSSKW